jgi:hypothetical protein
MMKERLIHKIYQELNLPKPAVSISHHMPAIYACIPNFINRFAASLRNRWYNFGIIDTLMRHRTLDFIGLNYYFHFRIPSLGPG